VVLVLVVVVSGVVAIVAARRRADAASSVADEATPELVAAENLYGALADADATATTTYLEGGPETAAFRLRYDGDVVAAGNYLAAVAKQSGSSALAQRSLHTLASDVATYAGLVEEARANNRQGFSVGTAYLNQSSALMRDKLLPAAATVYEQSADRLDDAYRSGTSSIDLVVVLFAAFVAVGLLVGVQLFLFRRTHRILNLGLLAATALVLVIAGWSVGQFWHEQSALVDAQRHGSDGVQVLSAARIDALRARSDDNLELIARGTGQAFVADFQTMRTGLTALVDDAATVALRRGDTTGIDATRRDLTTLLNSHDALRSADGRNDYQGAVSVATDTEANASARLDRALRGEINTSVSTLEGRATAAHDGFGLLVGGIVFLSLLAAALVLLGLQPRIGEYQ
jgi:hypothetical protein